MLSQLSLNAENTHGVFQAMLGVNNF